MKTLLFPNQSNKTTVGWKLLDTLDLDKLDQYEYIAVESKSDPASPLVFSRSLLKLLNTTTKPALNCTLSGLASTLAGGVAVIFMALANQVIKEEDAVTLPVNLYASDEANYLICTHLDEKIDLTDNSDWKLINRLQT